MQWPWRKSETRGTSYTEQLITASVREAEQGTSDRLLATIEAVVGLWERSLASATSTTITRRQLAIIGRGLLLSGESVWPVRAGSLGFSPASTWEVSGTGDSPRQWRYRLHIQAPNGQRSVSRSGADVCHFRIGTTATRPWEGCSPLVSAGLTVSALRKLETSILHESGGPTGQLLPVPASGETEDGQTDQNDVLAGDLACLRGKVGLLETSAGGYDTGRAGAPARDWRPIRIGPTFGDHESAVRQQLEDSIISAAGVPHVLLTGQSGDTRESWRQFVFSTIRPLADLIAEEATRAGVTTTIDTSALAATDVAARARAVRQLVEAKVPIDEARAVAGI